MLCAFIVKNRLPNFKYKEGERTFVNRRFILLICCIPVPRVQCAAGTLNSGKPLCGLCCSPCLHTAYGAHVWVVPPAQPHNGKPQAACATPLISAPSTRTLPRCLTAASFWHEHCYRHLPPQGSCQASATLRRGDITVKAPLPA